jgi:hypothetical protein
MTKEMPSPHVPSWLPFSSIFDQLGLSFVARKSGLYGAVSIQLWGIGLVLQDDFAHFRLDFRQGNFGRPPMKSPSSSIAKPPHATWASGQKLWLK